MTAGLVVAGILLLALLLVWRVVVYYRRANFIHTYQFPKGLFDKLAARRPELAQKDIALVSRGLRHFFLAYLGCGRHFVSMPSQMADDLWHEFNLYPQLRAVLQQGVWRIFPSRAGRVAGARQLRRRPRACS